MRRADGNAFSAAGWLLAELSLILMVVMMGSEGPANDDGLVPVAAPTAESSPEPTPTAAVPSPSPPPGLDTELNTFYVVMNDWNDAVAADELLGLIAASPDHRPGLILLFGVTLDPGRPTAGRDLASNMANLLVPSLPDPVVIRAFHQLPNPGHPLGEIRADIYYYQNR